MKFDKLCQEGSIQINLISTISELTSRILLACSLGDDVNDIQVDYWENGVVTKKNLAFALRNTFTAMVSRLSRVHVCIFPFLANVFITPWERDLK